MSKKIEKKNYSKLKLKKYLLFMLILICSLINISKTNSPIEIKNFKPVNDGKRILNEQIDNYIIIEFNEAVTYEGGQFLNNGNNWMGNAINYNQYISYIIN